MRPDPYKRARSRQYKARHGIIDSKATSKFESNLPSNISDEQIFMISDAVNSINQSAVILLVIL